MQSKVFEQIGLDDLRGVAEEILAAWTDARIFAFYGNLGAGKTTLIQRICAALGVKKAVTSPTFTLVNEYEGASETMYHFDFYRIKTETEAYDIGVDEYFDSGDLCMIEWPEKIDSLIPPRHFKISLKISQDQQREITLHKYE